ncbi:hypothetical protein [endosymbiont GvMRE of Glomus versiforme]|uniref:hypothetical protein n=1 Tax=endosymbiont GvMRE of Glomus versiforme TaxID=2039283 RepID=UPI000EE0FD9C|nr:hypothetical protein [endosymbiont GvMRE of Glomus versiforme]RHZ37050.1 hypothetical protein GvMRE_I2g10 [endosymbiont GvMRE of Glomus versiforme]
MKGYSAQEIERLFSRAGRTRPKSKSSGDAGYWTGGHCNYGASHNLHEDCETLARGFANIESLGNIKDVLKQCTSEVEFNSKKNDFVRRCEEAINGLRPHIGAHSSMFGICIIWGEEAMDKHVEKVIKQNKKEIEKVKSLLEKETYKWVEELRQLELEINEIKARMEENKRKAMDPNISPSEKAALLEEIENDGKLLQQKYAEHKAHSNKFRFDPSKYVSDMIEAMRRAIEKGDRDGSGNGGNGNGGGGSGRNKDPSDPNNPFGDDNDSDDPDGNNNKKPPKNKKKDKDDNQPNQQLIILAIVVLVVLFLLMNQSNKPIRRYDEYDY